jgi:xanthine dehydrogenase accessory factor
MDDSLENLLRRAATLRRGGGRVVGCLLVNARGSTPQSAGALMLVDDAARTYGTIGGGCVEAEVRKQAFGRLSAGVGGLLHFKLDHDYGWDDGLICGGSVELAVGPLPDADTLDRIADDIAARRETPLSIEVETDAGPMRYTAPIPPRERLYIAGAGHVGQALARQALRLDFEVTIFDDRADLLAKAAPPGATPVAGDIAAKLTEAPIDGDTCCVIVTRGHRHDEQALHAVAERGAGYVGMIGSRRKVKLIADDLRERGVSAEALEAVHAPIGLDIGSVTVEEIAISIAAQLVQVRRAKRRPTIEGPVPAAARPPARSA